MREIYISTGAFKSKDIEWILKVAKENNIKNIELSSGLEYNPKTIDIVLENKEHFNFVVHNYFPAPEYPFVLNLASTDKSIIKKSMELCKNAIDLSVELGAEFYSLHCGFTFNSTGKELGNESQLALERVDFNDAYASFITNLRELCKYAGQKNIKLAIENNVLAEFAVARGKNMYIGVDTEDFKQIFSDVADDNLYMLLDVAHAKVSDTFLKFDICTMVKELKNKILVVHISDNDGRRDSNLPIRKGSDVAEIVKLLNDRHIVLESYNLEPTEIKSQVKLLGEILNDK